MELAALDPAVVVESAPVAESVILFSPSHTQYIAEKEELNETALLSNNVQFVLHSDMQTIHIEEHVPSLTYGSAPAPISVRLFTNPHIQNCTESLVFMPVTLCYPLPEYVHLYLLLYSQDMAYVCDAMVLVEVLPVYFNSTDAPAASQGGIVPSSADPCYGPALPVMHSASLYLLTEKGESSND